MSLKKIDGFIIKSFNNLGIDTIITLLPERDHVCKFRLKGLQKSRKKSQTIAEIGSYVSLEYYYKENRDIYYVKEIDLLERFENIKNNYKGYILLSYLSELLVKFLNEGEKHNKEYILFYGALQELNKNGIHSFFLPFFQIRLLKSLGFIAMESNCCFCMKPFGNHSNIGLDQKNFQFYCEACHNVITDQKQLLSFLIDCCKLKFDSVKVRKLDKNILFMINQFIFDYIAFLGVYLKSQNMLKFL